MTYKIELSRSAQKQISELPHNEIKKIAKRIDKLASNPLPPGHEKLKGQEEIYRIRQGDYRILYSIFEARLLILILKIGHRREVYR